jgi:NTE family protein
MPKTALVLNGCGARGAFQFGAEKYAREVKGFKWDIIAGVSVGALNGVMLAMEKYQHLEEIWRTITGPKVFKGGMNLWTVLRLAMGATSVYSADPLCEMIHREVEPEKVKVPVRVGTVSLYTGEYRYFTAQDPDFKQAILASAAIPILWPPVDISPELKGMVDGGVRNISPLGDVLDADPGTVVIIDCSPPEPARMEWPPRSILDISRRALELASHEIFVTDCLEFYRINQNVLQAGKHGVTLYNENGKPFKFYDHYIIDPGEPLGDALDFSRATVERSIQLGWDRAKELLE